MPFVSIDLPPGVRRNGTRYQARGRWHDSQLVRWVEKAMQPWGGWQAAQTDLEAVAAAISDDGGVFTDETADANNSTADDVVLVPASPQVGDAFYLGRALEFTGVEIHVSTVATDGAVTWEYFNGSTWVALSGVSDLTDSFKTSGQSLVAWTRPTDWATTTVNAQGPFFYVRARVTTAGTTTALGQQCWIGVSPVRLGAPVRGLLAWRDNSQRAHWAVGTPSKAWAWRVGQLIDITPAGFTAGTADATAGGGFGVGPFGAGPFGLGSAGEFDTIVEAQTWQFDNFGEQLVAQAFSDGKLYSWDLAAGNDLVQMTGSPTSCKGIVVTPERFVFALGAGGDARKVQWPDQESLTDWTPTATNQAGDFILDGAGSLQAGRRGRGETLLWTDDDLWAAQYIGGVLVYQFRRVGTSCGAISRLGIAMLEGLALWMSHRAFFVYDGSVRDIPSDVSDYVFSDINLTQRSKICAVPMPEFDTVLWFYPSAGSTENDRYVAFNVKGRHWEIGKLERTSGAAKGVFDFTLMADSTGVVYDHERGVSYLSPTGATLSPSAESGPIELGQGDNVYDVVYLVPDEATIGDVQATFFTAFYPNDTEVTRGPFTLTKQTSVRFAGRQVRLKVAQVQPEWRWGTPRLDVRPAGRR